MLRFLANVLEQMDLALDQLAVNDANYKRFALMLVDNVVELTLHQYAVEKSNSNRMWQMLPPKYPPKLVADALGQYFDDKVKLAAETGYVPTNIKETLNILHSFRNEVYHRGMTHEEILPAVSLFYFQNACWLLETFDPGCFSYGDRQKLPHRAQKYLGAKPSHTSLDDFKAACKRLREISESHDCDLIGDLARKVESMIGEADHNIQFLADDAPNGDKTREGALVDTQLWKFAFTDEAKDFAKQKNCPAKDDFEYLKWLKDQHPWKYRKDPIPSWKKRLVELGKEKDRHRALLLYKHFADQTEYIRDLLTEAAGNLDDYIQTEIDRVRNK
ncbi:MAG TPA: hypothetical protein VN578_06490 [Candidatus Binatia bacterium]|jgi:hypothetical protein|nr:hypothetical protein [Candidatus Binatia bacterium]